MFTHAIDSYGTPSQNKTRQKLLIKNKIPKIQILEFYKKHFAGSTPSAW